MYALGRHCTMVSTILWYVGILQYYYSYVLCFLDSVFSFLCQVKEMTDLLLGKPIPKIRGMLYGTVMKSVNSI